MVLAIHSDAPYLNKLKAWSRVGGHPFLLRNYNLPPNNGAVLNISQIIKAGMSLADKSKLGALSSNAKYTVPVDKNLEEVGHIHPPTPTYTDNYNSNMVINNNIQTKVTKSMDIRFCCLRDRECQKQFQIYWISGTTNLVDFWMKNHSVNHHQRFRPEIITSRKYVDSLKQVL